MDFQLDIPTLFQNNAISFKDHGDHFIIDGHFIPKSRILDSLRLIEFVRPRIPSYASDCLSYPKLCNQRLDVPPQVLWDYKHQATMPVAVSDQPKVWGGIYQTHSSDYIIQQEIDLANVDLDDIDLATLSEAIAISLPLDGPAYVNIAGPLSDLLLIVKKNRGINGAKVIKCSEACIQGTHHHYVYARYHDKLVIKNDSGEVTDTIFLAPPIDCGSVEIGDLKLNTMTYYHTAMKVVDEVATVEMQKRASTSSQNQSEVNEPAPTTVSVAAPFVEKYDFGSADEMWANIEQATSFVHVTGAMRNSSNIPYRTIVDLSTGAFKKMKAFQFEALMKFVAKIPADGIPIRELMQEIKRVSDPLVGSNPKHMAAFRLLGLAKMVDLAKLIQVHDGIIQRE
jgi:hypothetical protein